MDNQLRTMESDTATQNATPREHFSAIAPADSAPADLDHDAGTADVPANGRTAKSRSTKGGPGPGNVNSLRHGLRGDPAVTAHRLILGTLPASMAKVERQARQFRAALEQAVVEAHGSITLSQACLIATAARWERHAMLALRWLRERHDALDDNQRLTFSREVGKASAERDKAIAALKLDRDAKESIFDLLYSQPAPPDVLPAPAPSDASTAAVSVQDGQQAFMDGEGGTDAP